MLWQLAFAVLAVLPAVRSAKLPLLQRSPEFHEAVLKDRRICPDVIPTAPGERCEVAWAHKNLNSDLAWTPNDVVECPHNVTYKYADDEYYVVIFTDPDVPSRENPTKREYLHWLVGNIYEDKWHTGETIAEYIGAVPEHMNGVHRMVFVVYKQPTKDFIRFDEKRLEAVHSDKDRANFSTRNFAKKYNLVGPIAANFFMAYWNQDMVKTLIKPSTTTTLDPIEAFDHTDDE